MKIVFLGNFGVSYSSESHYLKTFQKLGHEVITLQERETIPADRFDELLACDMFFWVHTHGWNTLNLDNLLVRLKARNIPVVGYHLDLWLGIAREQDLYNDAYWKWLDMFFCTDKLMVNWLNERAGYPKGFFMPAGVFEDECYLAESKDEFRYDVIFAGSRGYHAEWPYRAKLVSWLESTYGNRFKHFGGDSVDRRRITGHELNQLYASAKVVVGDTLCKDFTYPEYLSDRVFETTGRGGFLIMPYISGIENHFKIGEEVSTYVFNDFNMLKANIDYFINNDIEREQIRLKGHERTKAEHTYTHRLKAILEIVQSEINK